MNDQSSRTSREHDTADAAAAAVVHIPLAWHITRLNVGWIMTFLVGIIIGMMLMPGTRPVSQWLVPTSIIIGIALLTGAAIHLRLFYQRTASASMRRNDSPISCGIAEGSDALRDLVRSVETSRRAIGWWGHGMWKWSVFQQQREAMGVPRPKTIVDSSVAERVAEIGLPDDLVEPEPILSSAPQTRLQMVAIGALLGVLSFTWLMNGHYLLVGFAMGLFGMFAIAQRPHIRDHLRNLRFDDGRIVAGPGFVESWRGRQWTIDDAVMVIQVTRTAGPMYVHLIGDQGHLLLTFSDEHDPDFVKLWQRWNHPNPRTDLVST